MKTKEDLEKIIKMCAQHFSIPEETSKEWERFITTPCIETALAPRHARAILEVFGFLANYGVRPNAVLNQVITKYQMFFDQLE